jgi:hypothetical protein
MMHLLCRVISKSLLAEMNEAGEQSAFYPGGICEDLWLSERAI